MPYPEMMVAPMREDLVRVGFTEMRTLKEGWDGVIPG